jgi:hypothetical protein
MPAVNLKHDAEMTHDGSVKKAAQVLAPGQTKSTHLRMPGMQNHGEKGGEWQQGRKKDNCGTKEGNKVMPAVTSKNNAEGTRIVLAKMEAQTPAPGQAKSTHLCMPGMQNQTNEGEWHEVRNRKNRGSKQGNKIATASMNMGKLLNTPTISMPYKIYKPRVSSPFYTDNFRKGQSAHTNPKGRKLTTPKDNATLLPAGNDTSAQQIAAPKFVVDTPENVWELRCLTRTSPKIQVGAQAANEGKNISDVDHPTDMTPVNILGDNSTAPESKVSDVIQEAQKAKGDKRQAKKQRRAIEKARGIPRQRKKDKCTSVETPAPIIPRSPSGRLF